MFVGDSSSASLDTSGSCSEYNFCFRYTRYYPTSGSKYYYDKQGDSHVAVSKYGYGDNTETLEPGKSVVLTYTKNLDYRTSTGDMTLDGDVSRIFGKYFVTKDTSSYNPDSSPFVNTAIKLDVAINRSSD